MFEWPEVRVKDLFNLGRGRVISGIEISTNPGHYPVFSSQSSSEGRMGSIGTYDFEGEYVTWTTDGANAGTVFHRSGQFNCTNVCGTLKAKNEDEVSHKFMAYQLSRLTKRHVSYVGNPKLMNGVMAQIKLFHPPFAEQKQVANILETLDTQIRQTEAIIAKLQQVKQGLLHDLLTRGIDENGQLRPPYEQAPELYKESPLGWIPKEWEVSTIGKEFQVQLGKMLDAEKNTGFPKPYIGNKAVQWGRIDISEMQNMKMSGNDLIRFRLQEGDILVCEGGEVGRAAIWDAPIEECYYQKALHRLRAVRGFEPQLLVEFLFFLNSSNKCSTCCVQGS